MSLRLFPYLPDRPVTATPSQEELRSDVKREHRSAAAAVMIPLKGIGGHGGFLSREGGR